jgi:hypothetical protein
LFGQIYNLDFSSNKRHNNFISDRINHDIAKAFLCEEISPVLEVNKSKILEVYKSKFLEVNKSKTRFFFLMIAIFPILLILPYKEKN